VTVMIGTPHYMAPEVLAGEPATMRSDVWALGVVVHEILFGRRPERKSASFDGTTHGPIRPATPLERAVLGLAERCLFEAATDRPADAREVSRLFNDVTAGRGRRHSFRWRAAAVSAAVLSAMAVFASRNVVFHSGHRDGTSDGDPARAMRPLGAPQDWSKVASVVEKLAGRVHCFAPLSASTVRIVWGTPRKATDLNVETGRSSPANLVPESFQSSCPDLSVSSGRLLYSSRNPLGVMEIRLSNRSDGQDGVAVASGRDPRWLGSQPSFVYMVDELHAAVFSLATMELSLLSTGALDGRLEIGEAAVSGRGGRIAISGYDNRAGGWVQMFRRDEDVPFRQVSVPLGVRMAFGSRENQLYLNGPFSAPEITVARLDIDSGRLEHAGRIAGQDITRVAPVGERLSFVSRRFRSDVYSYEQGGHQQLTSDGDVNSAAKASSGDLLLGRRAADGTLSIWLRRANGTEKQVTHGPQDATPAFGPDGVSWAYVDYVGNTLRLCKGENDCSVLSSDKSMPTRPSFAPDGRRLSFVTQMGRPQMKILSRDGQLIAAWDALPVCAGIWSSNTTVWSVENARGVYYWAEHNALTGETSGRRVPFLNSAVEDSPLVDCRAEGADPRSALFHPIQVEPDERSEIRIIGAAQLGR
ncbi:MAG TPA: protein kinase, partial [Polyangia bacterium]|nr:protein kinase [Polyangia bacterium]